MTDDSPVWYFAYGSNLDRVTFIEQRRMNPLQQRVCRLAGYRITFDLPVGPGERGVANLQPADGESVWGVAFQLSQDDGRRLDQSEGVDFGADDRHAVRPVDRSGQAVEAFTYVSRHSAPGRKPSPRYIGLILRGARENQLPIEYVRELEALELAVDERETPS